VLIPEENTKDLVEISDSVKRGIEIIPVSHMDEVLARALTRKPVPIVWDEASVKPAVDASVEEVLGADRALIGHNATSKGLGGGFHREVAVRVAVSDCCG